jgi:hypothetical protein
MGRNGTKVDGKVYQENESVPLKDNSTLEIGKLKLHFKVNQANLNSFQDSEPNSSSGSTTSRRPENPQ